MKSITTLAGAVSLGLCTLSLPALAAAKCELDRPVKFGGMNWETNLIITEIERFIITKGYGCKTEVESGETLTMLAAMQRGDVDVNAEIWATTIGVPWEKAVASGKVKALGAVFEGTEGWYIPRYVAERFPALKSAADLPKFKAEFADPEEPEKGRFYNCPAGWSCGVSTANLFKALQLDDSFTLFGPGTGAAQKAAITSAYKRKRNIVFYYWQPTTVVGQLDLVKLDLPPIDPDAAACNTLPTCANPKPTGYPPTQVLTGVNTAFSEQAPQLASFLSKVAISTDQLNALLSWYEQEGAEPEEAAQRYLNEHPDVWSQWVPPAVAEQVKQAL